MLVHTVVGARPQFIKSGPVSRAFDASGINEQLVHTGQHYDLNMSDIFFEALGLRLPSHHLGLGSGSHGEQTGRMLTDLEKLFLSERPDAVLVYGDTNSTLAGALAAAKLHIPVFHVEAGLRSFNRRMPEELNRVLTDHISDLLFCPTQTAVGHLASEGISQNVLLVGDVMKDGVDYWSSNNTGAIDSLADLNLNTGEYFLATVHRAENVDHPERLSSILRAFERLEAPVVLPLHPRTRARLGDSGVSELGNVRVIDPVGYVEMLELQRGAQAILTDSGGVQKEAYMLGVPCITLRDETEWVETVDAGWNILVGADEAAIVNAAGKPAPPDERPELYGDGNASGRIVSEIQRFMEAQTQ